jgi:deoxyxylulose-5-phosphate synthase
VKIENKGVGAPEAAKLLRDLESEAKERVLARMDLPSNGLKAKLEIYRNNIRNSLEAGCVFNLNGKDYHVLASGEDIETLANSLQKEVSDTIAREIVARAFNEALAKNWSLKW